MSFDPFNDRKARDIRNSLSTALVEELTRAGKTSVTGVVRDWRSESLAEVYRKYIEQTQQTYQRVLEQVSVDQVDTPYKQSVVLWNAELYFELHELLETIWHGAGEPDRTALKGLIQAAGAYLHSRRGKPEAARKLAARAHTNLRKGESALSFIANLDELINALEKSPPTQICLVHRELVI